MLKKPVFQIYIGNDNKYYFRLIAKNREMILTSNAYLSELDCNNGIVSVLNSALDDKYYKEKTAKDGTFYFTISAKNGKIIGNSQMFKTKQSRTAGIKAVKKAVPFASVEDKTAQNVDDLIDKRIEEMFVGVVSSFAMNEPPEGWLECKGQLVSRKKHLRLFRRIGTTYGKSSNETTFRLPDLRGMFVRGWSHGTKNDPDKNGRYSIANGSAEGDNVGSMQNDAIEQHVHNLVVNKAEISKNHHHHKYFAASYKKIGGHLDPKVYGIEEVAYQRLDNSYSCTHTHELDLECNISDPSDASLSSETRPKNIALLYCIKF